MRFLGSVVTDIGTVKTVNQDSACVKIVEHGTWGQIALAVVCDGMGGLELGELASATVIRSFSNWFEFEFPEQLDFLDFNAIRARWQAIFQRENAHILQYGAERGIKLGTTASALLLVAGHYLIAHIGDSRIYQLSPGAPQPFQLTDDHTFVAREVREGRMTPEEAAHSSKKHLLLKCIGAAPEARPDFFSGELSVEEATFVLCSDGFRNRLTSSELATALNPLGIADVDAMHFQSRRLIELAKSRAERDNLTVALLKCVPTTRSEALRQQIAVAGAPALTPANASAGARPYSALDQEGITAPLR